MIVVKIKRQKKYGALNNMKNKKIYPKIWYSKNKEKISCKEKISLLNKNILDFNDLALEIYDEAILMGVKKEQIEEVLAATVKNINSNLKSV